MNGWTFKRGRLWSPRIWKWVIYVRFWPTRIALQRVLTDREFNAVIDEYNENHPPHDGGKWGWS